MARAPAAPVPVTVVTGFLGAGKTTLVNRWLGDYPRGDVAVIVNEHGTVGIDGALLEQRAKTLVEISGGCVCCSTQAELALALDELASAHPRPKRILVETSGAASPAGVVRVICANERREALVLDGIITVVDTSRLQVLTEHDLATEQVGYADIVVCSRADISTDDARRDALATIATHNAIALAVAASRGALEDRTIRTLDALLERRSSVVPAPAAGVQTTHVYESISLLHEGDLDGERFGGFMEEDLARFAGRLLRTKGILAVAGVAERMIVQGVADQVEISFGDTWGTTRRTSRFVIVGFGLDRAALEHAFASCAASSG